MALMTPAPQNFMEPIRSALAETLGLSYADILPQILHLRVALDQNVVSGIDEYRIDGGYHFLVWEVHAHLAPNAMNPLELDPIDFAALKKHHRAKAWNCNFSLYNPDREAMKFTETDVQNSAGNVALASNLGDLLKQPVKFCEGNDIMPLIVMENDRLRMSASLVKTAFDGDAGLDTTEYGVMLIGAFVRARTT